MPTAISLGWLLQYKTNSYRIRHAITELKQSLIEHEHRLSTNAV